MLLDGPSVVGAFLKALRCFMLTAKLPPKCNYCKNIPHTLVYDPSSQLDMSNIVCISWSVDRNVWILPLVRP